MAALYILDVPEFSVLAEAVTSPSARREKIGDYVKVTVDEGPLELDRSRVGARDAVWFAAATGGFRGRITVFDATLLRLED